MGRGMERGDKGDRQERRKKELAGREERRGERVIQERTD